MTKLHIKKGDAVIITAGKDKGKSGVINKVVGDKVIVDGLNLVYKHKKAKNAQERNEIAQQPAPIDASNVMLVCGACGKAARTGNSYEMVDSKKIAVRTCKKCGAKIEEAKAKSAAKKVAKKATAAKKKVDKTADKADAKATVAKTDAKTE